MILAAGFGTRMKSALPKTLHKIAGRSMLRHLLATASRCSRIVVVIGPGMEAVRGRPRPPQRRQQDAVAPRTPPWSPLQFGDGEVAILYADNPLIRPATLSRLLERHSPGMRAWPCWRSARPIQAVMAG